MPLTTARRISYVIPPPHSLPPYLSLPSPTHPRNGSPHPILLPLSEPGISASLSSSSFFPSSTSETVSHPQHHLGISALALDTSTQLSGKDTPEGILYTGGRDGLVASWELGANMGRKRSDGGNEENIRWNEVVDDDDWEDDEEDEVKYSSTAENLEEADEDTRWKRMPWEDRWEAQVYEDGSTKPPEATFRQCMQYHTDWVNDILLCNLNQTLISASSDRTIRAWSPHTSTPDHQQAPTIIGTHTDYVHSLTHSKHNAWVASGGFDRQIKLWDISQGSSHASTSLTPGAAKGPEPIIVLGSGDAGEEQIRSVYSLETNPSGRLIVSGGPDGVVRMWDPRTGGKQIGQLMGHTENVRALRLSEDGRFLLSGSSDTTVKLWSISSQRTIHTFTHHSASITALFTSHPNLERFYTGDLSGHVSIVDLQRCSDISDGECISLLQEGVSSETSSPTASKDEEPRNPLANRGSVAINKIVALDDQYVWTATASSTVNMWKDVGRRIRRNPAFRSANDLDDQSSSAHSSADGVLVGHHEQDEEEESWEVSKEQREQLLADEFKMPARTFTPPGSEKNSPRNSWHTGSIGLSLPPPASPSQLLTADSSSPFSNKTSILKPTQVRTLSGITIKRGSSDSPSIEPSSSGFSTIFGHRILQTQLEEPESNKLFCDRVPYESLINLSPLNDPYEFLSPHHHQANPDQVTHFSTASILSLPTRAKPQPIPSAVATEILGVSPSNTTRGDPPSMRPTPTMQTPNLPSSDMDVTPERGTGARFNLPLSRDAEREARSKFLQRELLVDAVPFNRDGPSGAIYGKHGLVRSLMFNDRQHVVTCDTAGVIALWNIVFGQCIGLIDSSAVVEAHNSMSTSSKLITPRDALELVKERMEGEAVVPTWCSVDTKIGGLTVSLERGRCFDAEVHLDELILRGLQGDYKDDQRVSLGKLLLANLFDGFVKAELLRHQHSPDENLSRPTKRSTQTPPTYIPLGSKVMGFQSTSQPPTPGGMGAMSALATPAMTAALAPTDDFFSSTIKKDYFPKMTSPVVSHQPLEIPTTTASMDTPMSPGAVQTPGGSFMGKFKGFGKNKKLTAGTTPALPVAEISEEEAQRLQDEAKYGKLAPIDLEQKRLLDTLFSNPLNPPKPAEIPLIPSLSDVAIVIDEESRDAGAWAVTYRGSVAHASHEVDTLEMTLPSWVLEYLLAGRVPVKETVNMSFVLEPCKFGLGAMAEMPNGNSRLTANRALRIRKICAYIFDRLGMGPPISRRPSFSTPHGSPKSHAASLPAVPHYSSIGLPVSDELPRSPPPVRPEDVVELVCNGLVLPSNMTLAAVKHFVWRQGGDVVLSYRLKTQFEGAQFEEINTKN
ncbi:Conserved WD40 repeat-containing protein [Phaffia rhodozyma]|uniref:Conserved WD40 repeat-containing protein n=1 Tax=Phaffia rhodozyma TaxID=264483 RepID=A0A0F7SH66_PHARH|nr:Conserved WD40 repeat-containing protein [Phaffia rhodozyma]